MDKISHWRLDILHSSISLEWKIPLLKPSSGGTGDNYYACVCSGIMFYFITITLLRGLLIHLIENVSMYHVSPSLRLQAAGCLFLINPGNYYSAPLVVFIWREKCHQSSENQTYKSFPFICKQKFSFPNSADPWIYSKMYKELSLSGKEISW